MAEAQHPTFGNGKICYIELPALDVERSASFYREVFGWKTRRRGDGSVAFDDGVGEVSGTWVLGRTPAPASGLLVHIMVNDAVAAIEAVIAQGGKLIEPIGKHSPEITAQISDPAGNVIGIYQHGR